MKYACSLDWKLVLEYVKVAVSWQVIVGIAIFVGGRWFSAEIKALINRIASLEVPGVKLVTQQEKTDEAKPSEDAPVSLPPLPLEEGTVHLNAEQVDYVRHSWAADREAARLWEFRYLNYYFAPSTHAVLDWLISVSTKGAVSPDWQLSVVSATTRRAFEAFWAPRIASAGERTAILDALQHHNCALIDGEMLGVMGKGEAYAAWAGRRILSASPDAAQSVV